MRIGVKQGGVATGHYPVITLSGDNLNIIMKDKEILATVYRWMNQSIQRGEDAHFAKRRLKDCKDFIEREWQKEDELDKSVEQMLNANVNEECKGHFSDSWYNKNCELEIGEDGTVNAIK